MKNESSKSRSCSVRLSSESSASNLPLPGLVTPANSSPANFSFAEKLRQATAGLYRSSITISESPSFLNRDSEDDGCVSEEEELSDSLRSDTDDDDNSDLLDDDETSEMDSQIGLTRSQRIAGLICSLGLCLAWLGMSLLASDFKSPVFSRYFVVSMYSFLGLLWYIMMRRKRRICENILAEQSPSEMIADNDENNHNSHTNSNNNNNSTNHRQYTETTLLKNSSESVNYASTAAQIKDIMVDESVKEKKKAMKILNEQLSKESLTEFAWELLPYSIPLAWLGTLNGWLWYLSLEQTDVAVNTCIFQSSCAIIYLLSCFVTKSATLTVQKTVSVSVCLFGVGLISLASEGKSSGSNDNDVTETTLVGLMLCILAMLCYSGFVVLIEYVESRFFRKLVAIEDSILLNSIIGLSTLLTVWPLLVVCYLTGFDSLSVPLPWNGHSAADDFYSMIYVSLFDMGYVLFLMLGVAMSNAILMSAGSLMVIPISFFVDSVILNKYQPTVMGMFGALLICAGFFCLQVPLSDVTNFFYGLMTWFLRTTTKKKKQQQQKRKMNNKKLSLSNDNNYNYNHNNHNSNNERNQSEYDHIINRQHRGFDVLSGKMNNGGQSHRSWMNLLFARQK